MSRLKKIREQLNLTQEDLSEKSTISVRTIQRIEAGVVPKGKTLQILSRTLGIQERELLEPTHSIQEETDITFAKLLNISSLPFSIVPPLNVIIPLVIMVAKKQFHPLAKQLVSIQIIWLLFAGILFMLSSFVKNGFRSMVVLFWLL